MVARTKNLKERAILSTDAEAWLRCEPSHFFKFQPEDFLRDLWESHRDRIIEEHVAESPGTRPERWWEYDAPRSPRGTYPGCFYDGKLPEPRKRLGGAGTPQYEVLCVVPSFAFGIPVSWLDEWQVAYYKKGVAIDAEDPPTFESQATYLDRHGLFLPGERRRLKADGWETECVLS